MRVQFSRTLLLVSIFYLFIGKFAMTSSGYGLAASTIFNVSRSKYGPTRAFTPAAGWTSKISGWSPTGNLPPNANLETIEEEKRVEEFQRSWLYNFTVRELVDLDVISGRVLDQGNLRVPIHPIFSKNVWEKSGERPTSWPLSLPEITHTGGRYTMDNPPILDAMMPVLTLASAFISRMHALPFIDAFLFGPKKPMEQTSSTLTLPNGLYTFWRRPPGGQHTLNDFAECQKECSLSLRLLHGWIKWGFAPGSQLPWEDQPDPNTGCLGVTTSSITSANKPTIWIFLDQNLCNLLLRNDLTSAEKAEAQFFLAMVMCHELMHAIWLTKRNPPHNRDYEPYFEDAPQCELGYEMENNAFGGIIEPLFGAPAAPMAYSICSTYPHYSNMRQRVPDTVILNKARPYNDATINYFLPIQTFEDLRKQIFWDSSIRQYGFSVISARAIKHGWKVDYAPDWNNVDSEGCPSFSRSPLSRIGYLQGIQLNNYDEVAASAAAHQGKQLPPRRKAAFNMLEEIIESASKEEAFYDFTLAQEDNLWEIRETFVSLRDAQNKYDRAEAHRLTQDLMKMLNQATVNHKESFVLLDRSETLRGGAMFRDRRAILFRWNTGTRRLLNELFTMVNDIPNRQGEVLATFNRLMDLLSHLDYVRLQIFPPTSTWKLGDENTPEGTEELKKWPIDFFHEDLDEFKFLAALYTAAINYDLDQCRLLVVGRLQGTRGGSTLSFYCRYICVGISAIATSEFLEKNCQERRVVVDPMIAWLIAVRVGCTKAWLPTFQQWIKWFEKFGEMTEDEKRQDEYEKAQREQWRKRRIRY
ncbi:hypothetical protein NHQ30_006179 [Ciborinia camelliae]|nr:hypothetical protein NHQ30_006179 [Ciborinia camelliae]